MLNIGTKLRFDIKTAALVLVAFTVVLAACTSSQEPAEQVDPAFGPPPSEIPGKWSTHMAENVSQERDGILVKVKQLRFGTLERMFPNASESELSELGLNGVKGFVGVFMEIENKSGATVDLLPGGETSSIVLDSGEELKPLSSYSNVGISVHDGNIRNGLIVFPVSQTELLSIDEVTYSFDGLEFRYTDLIGVQAPVPAD